MSHDDDNDDDDDDDDNQREARNESAKSDFQVACPVLWLCACARECESRVDDTFISPPVALGSAVQLVNPNCAFRRRW